MVVISTSDAGVMFIARAIEIIEDSDGCLCPRSSIEMNVRSSPDSDAKVSWETPFFTRSARSVCPNATSTFMSDDVSLVLTIVDGL